MPDNVSQPTVEAIVEAMNPNVTRRTSTVTNFLQNLGCNQESSRTEILTKKKKLKPSQQDSTKKIVIAVLVVLAVILCYNLLPSSSGDKSQANPGSDTTKVDSTRTDSAKADTTKATPKAAAEKDIESLRRIFSDDALIITGSVIRVRTGGDIQNMSNKIVYTKSTKEKYLRALEGIFKRTKFLDVQFDEITVKRNGATGKGNFYGVSLKQNWNTDTYSDVGYVFLLWEFKDNGEPPVIHVRAWQPDKYADGKPLSEDDKLDMDNFTIP